MTGDLEERERLAHGWRVRLVAPGEPSAEVSVSTRGEGASVDGEPVAVHLDRRDETRGVLTEGDGPEPWRIPILFGPTAIGVDGVARRELLVDGWRIEVEIEQEGRAALRERALRSGSAAAGGGRGELRAIIPGKIVAVDVRPGDSVEAGQRLLVVEAMKMQNEFVAPRDGIIERVAVEPGATVERNDLLVVIR